MVVQFIELDYFSFSHNGHFGPFVLKPHFLHLMVKKLFFDFIILEISITEIKTPIPIPIHTRTTITFDFSSITSLAFLF